MHRQAQAYAIPPSVALGVNVPILAYDCDQYVLVLGANVDALLQETYPAKHSKAGQRKYNLDQALKLALETSSSTVSEGNEMLGSMISMMIGNGFE